MFNCKYIVSVLERIAQSNPNLAKDLDERGGFILSTEVPALIAIDPQLKVLVRCGNNRFVCPIIELAGLYRVISEGKHKDYDYVRDVSIPVAA
jgi:hypothetical protein